MPRLIAHSIVLLLSLAVLGAPVEAKPEHPDVAVALSLERVGPDVHLKAKLENQGQAAAHNVRLEIHHPTGRWTFGPPSASCSGDEKVHKCRIQDIPAGSATTIRGIMHDAPCHELAASASAKTPSDKGHRNDNAEASLSSACGRADVSVTKVGIRVATEVTFNIDVVNVGPRPARHVTLVDELPAAATPWRVHGPDDHACRLAGSRLECRWADLPLGDPVTVRVTATVGLCRTVTNTAQAHSTDDPDASNNSSTATVHGLCAGAAGESSIPAP